MADIAANREFRPRVAAIDSGALSADNQLDREQLLRAIDSQLVTLEHVRPWANDPDVYSSGLTRTAYIIAVPRHIHRSRPASAAAHQESDAWRDWTTVSEQARELINRIHRL